MKKSGGFKFSFLHRSSKPYVFRHRLTLRQKAADTLAKFVGSWMFIAFVAGLIVVWVWANMYLLLQRPFDPYPFILLNLVLGCLSALYAPVILMAQNRQAERDRIHAHYVYMGNRKAEREIQMILKELKEIRRKV